MADEAEKEAEDEVETVVSATPVVSTEAVTPPDTQPEDVEAETAGKATGQATDQAQSAAQKKQDDTLKKLQENQTLMMFLNSATGGQIFTNLFNALGIGPKQGDDALLADFVRDLNRAIGGKPGNVMQGVEDVIDAWAEQGKLTLDNTEKEALLAKIQALPDLSKNELVNALQEMSGKLRYTETIDGKIYETKTELSFKVTSLDVTEAGNLKLGTDGAYLTLDRGVSILNVTKDGRLGSVEARSQDWDNKLLDRLRDGFTIDPVYPVKADEKGEKNLTAYKITTQGGDTIYISKDSVSGRLPSMAPAAAAEAEQSADTVEADAAETDTVESEIDYAQTSLFADAIADLISDGKITAQDDPLLQVLIAVQNQMEDAEQSYKLAKDYYQSSSHNAQYGYEGEMVLSSAHMHNKDRQFQEARRTYQNALDAVAADPEATKALFAQIPMQDDRWLPWLYEDENTVQHMAMALAQSGYGADPNGDPLQQLAALYQNQVGLTGLDYADTEIQITELKA